MACPEWFINTAIVLSDILRGPLEESNVIVRDPLVKSLKWNWYR